MGSSSVEQRKSTCSKFHTLHLLSLEAEANQFYTPEQSRQGIPRTIGCNTECRNILFVNMLNAVTTTRLTHVPNSFPKFKNLHNQQTPGPNSALKLQTRHLVNWNMVKYHFGVVSQKSQISMTSSVGGGFSGDCRSAAARMATGRRFLSFGEWG